MSFTGTALELQRAGEVCTATVERDPRQGAAPIPEVAADLVARSDPAGTRNLDRISGALCAHPYGTGVGAALGGAAAGVAVGTVAGPVGTVLGAAVCAIIGWLAGKGVAELIDPTVEDAYWRTNFSTRSYVAPDAAFDDYGPAYGYGESRVSGAQVDRSTTPRARCPPAGSACGASALVRGVGEGLEHALRGGA